MKKYLKVSLPVLAIVAFVVVALLGRPSESATADRQQSERGPVPISLTFVRKEALATPPFMVVSPASGMSSMSFSYDKAFGLSWGWVTKKADENRVSVWYRLVALKNVWANAQFKVGDRIVTPDPINISEQVGNTNYLVGVSHIDIPADKSTLWVSGRACMTPDNCSEWSERMVFIEQAGVEPKQIGTINGIYNCAIDFVRFVDPIVSVYDPTSPSNDSPWGKLIGETHLGELEQSKVIDLSDRIFGRQQLVVVSKWEGMNEAVEKIWVTCPDRPAITPSPTPTIVPINVVITGTATTSCADRNSFETNFTWSGNDADVTAPLEYQKTQRFAATGKTEVKVNVSLRGGVKETWVFETQKPNSLWCNEVHLPLIMNAPKPTQVVYIPCAVRTLGFEYISGLTGNKMNGFIPFVKAGQPNVFHFEDFTQLHKAVKFFTSDNQTVDSSHYHYVGDGRSFYKDARQGPTWEFGDGDMVPTGSHWFTAWYKDPITGDRCIAAAMWVLDPPNHPTSALSAQEFIPDSVKADFAQQ